jgi:hypothetical protein
MSSEETVSSQLSAVSSSADDPLADAQCPQCGYSLRGLTEDRCPECGKPFGRQALANSFVPQWPRLMVWYLGAYVAASVLTITRLMAQQLQFGGGQVNAVIHGLLSQYNGPATIAASFGIVLAGLAIAGLRRRRDWGRKACIALEIVRASAWLLPLLWTLVVAHITSVRWVSMGWIPGLMMPRSFDLVFPSVVILVLLRTGLRPRTLARGRHHGPMTLSLSLYHPRQDWPLLMIVLIVAAGISHLEGPAYMLLLPEPRAWLQSWRTAIGWWAVVGVDLAVLVWSAWGTVRMWRRPERTRRTVAILAWLVVAANTTNELVYLFSLNRPPIEVAAYMALWFGLSTLIEALPPLALYLYAVREIDAEAIRRVTISRADEH